MRAAPSLSPLSHRAVARFAASTAWPCDVGNVQPARSGDLVACFLGRRAHPRGTGRDAIAGDRHQANQQQAKADPGIVVPEFACRLLFPCARPTLRPHPSFRRRDVPTTFCHSPSVPATHPRTTHDGDGGRGSTGSAARRWRTASPVVPPPAPSLRHSGGGVASAAFAARPAPQAVSAPANRAYTETPMA